MVTLLVANDRSDNVVFEVSNGNQLIGELERLPSGGTGALTLQLTPGAYQTTCLFGSSDTGGQLLVGTSTSPARLGQPADLLSAVTRYRTYLESQASQLMSATSILNSAIANGNLESARQWYEIAQQLYQHVRPAAANFGDSLPSGLANLDAAIDSPFDQGTGTGFHKIEYQLWNQNSTAGLGQTTSDLVSNVSALATRIGTEQIDAVRVASGLTDLLSDVTTQYLTGEAEIFSGLALSDSQGALDAVHAGLEDLGPPLAVRDRDLASSISSQYAQTQSDLSRYGSGTSFISLSELEPQSTRILVDSFDALANDVAQAPSALSRPVGP